MTELLPFLKSLMSVSALSGYEGPASKIIEEEWTLLVDEISKSKLGALHALKHGNTILKGNTKRTKRPSILIATHMDAVGMMVKKVVDGFLYVTEIGGLDPRILPGTPVVVHGKRDLYGVVAMRPGDLLPEEDKNNEHNLEYLLIDTGLTPSEVSRLVHAGDLVAYNTQPVEMSSGEIVSGHSLDNRASVAALTVCLQELQTRQHLWDVWAVATVQEEETMSGAYTSAYQLRPDIAVAVDVTFARGPGATGWDSFPLGDGPTLGLGPNVHTFLHKQMNEVAEKIEIPHAVDYLPRHSGTDVYMMQVASEGIPTMVLSIPLRYMHTPVEMIKIKDVRRAGRLLAEFIASLDADFIEKISWE